MTAARTAAVLRRSRVLRTVVASALVLAALGAACGHDEDDGAVPVASPSPTPSSTTSVPSADVVEMLPTSSLPICKPVTSIITDPSDAPPPEHCGVDPAIGGDPQMDAALRRLEEMKASGEADIGGMAGFDGPWFRVPQGRGHLVVGWSAYADGDRWVADVLVRNDTQQGTAIRVDALLTLRDGSMTRASGVGPIVARPGEPVPVRVQSDVPIAEVADAELVASAGADIPAQNRSFYVHANYARRDGDELVWGLGLESMRDEPIEAATLVVGVLGDDGFRFLTLDVPLDLAAFVVQKRENSAGGAGTTLSLADLPGDPSNIRTLLWAYAD